MVRKGMRRVSTRDLVTASLISAMMAGTVMSESALLMSVETEGSFLMMAPVSRTRVWTSFCGSESAMVAVVWLWRFYLFLCLDFAVQVGGVLYCNCLRKWFLQVCATLWKFCLKLNSQIVTLGEICGAL